MVATDYLKTTKPLNTQAPPAGRLQRLGFIPVYSSIAYGYAASAYEAAKSYVPAGIKPRVESAEKLYSKNVQPIVAKFTDGGQEILLVLDKRVRFSEKKYLELVVTRDRSALSLEVDGRIFQVDTALNKSYSVYKQKVNSPQVQDFSDTLSSTKAAVTKQFKDSISLVQDKGLTGTFTVAKQKAFALADESIILAKRVLGIAQQRSQAVIDIGLKKSEQVHDTVVKQPLYKRAYDSSNNLITTAQDTSVYKETYKIVYPYVAPIADPAIEKIQPYFNNTVNYWKPVSAAA